MQENVLLTRQARSSTMKSKPVSLPVHRDCGRAVSAVSRHIPAAGPFRPPLHIIRSAECRILWLLTNVEKNHGIIRCFWNNALKEKVSLSL